MCGLLASAIVQRLDAGAAFGGFFGVVPQQPGLSAQGLPFAACLGPRDFCGDLMLASQVQFALQRAFAFIEFVEIGMFRCGLLGRCQSAIEVVKLELMLVAILLGLGDFPIQLLELTGER